MGEADGSSRPEKSRMNKNLGGHPKFKPTQAQRERVEELAGYGIPHADICRLIIVNPETGSPIDEKTLRVHFRRELDAGHVKANSAVAGSLFAQATAGNVTAAIWWTKARMGWSEKIEHGGNLSLSISKTDAAL